MSKSYNPFEMIGSWIGFGIILIPMIILITFTERPECNFAVCITSNEPLYIMAVILAGLGFVVGWVINILIKKIKK